MHIWGMSDESVKPGTYRLYIMTCGYSEGEYPQYLRAPGGVIIYTMEKKADGTLNVYEGDPLETNGIEDVTSAINKKVAGTFNLNGMRLPSMQKGINIIRMENGETIKVLK